MNHFLVYFLLYFISFRFLFFSGEGEGEGVKPRFHYGIVLMLMSRENAFQ